MPTLVCSGPEATITFYFISAQIVYMVLLRFSPRRIETFFVCPPGLAAKNVKTCSAVNTSCRVLIQLQFHETYLFSAYFLVYVLATPKTLGVFWRGIQQQYKNGTDIFDGNNHWLFRGIRYRTLVEPLDIANWYIREKHLHDGHYIDGIPEHDELVDNDKRPGRYILLQRIEKERSGRTLVSSLSTARQVKDILKNTSWEDFSQEEER